MMRIVNKLFFIISFIAVFTCSYSFALDNKDTEYKGLYYYNIVWANNGVLMNVSKIKLEDGKILLKYDDKWLSTPEEYVKRVDKFTYSVKDGGNAYTIIYNKNYKKMGKIDICNKEFKDLYQKLYYNKWRRCGNAK